MYSTFKEQEESEKTENCTVPEIKVKILNLLLLKKQEHLDRIIQKQGCWKIKISTY